MCILYMTADFLNPCISIFRDFYFYYKSLLLITQISTENFEQITSFKNSLSGLTVTTPYLIT